MNDYNFNGTVYGNSDNNEFNPIGGYSDLLHPGSNGPRWPTEGNVKVVTVNDAYPNAKLGDSVGIMLAKAPDLTPGVSGGPTQMSGRGRVDANVVLSVGSSMNPGKVFYKGTPAQIQANWDNILYSIYKDIGKGAMSYDTWKQNVLTPLYNNGSPSTVHEFATNFIIPNEGKIFFDSNEQAKAFINRSTSDLTRALHDAHEQIYGNGFLYTANQFDQDRLDIMLGNQTDPRRVVAYSRQTRQNLEAMVHDIQGIQNIPPETANTLTQFQEGLANGSTHDLATIRGWLANSSDTYNHLITMFRNIRGPQTNTNAQPIQDAVHGYQSGLAQGNFDINAVQRDIAHAEPTRQAISKMIHDFNGQPYTNANTFTLSTPEEAFVKSFQDQMGNDTLDWNTLRGWIANNSDTYNHLITMIKNMRGSQANTQSQAVQDAVHAYQNGLAQGNFDINAVQYDIAHSEATRIVLNQMAQNSPLGKALDNATMQQEMDQVSQYGFDVVNQQFNQVMNTYKNIMGSSNDIDTTHIVQYQQMTNNKEINKAIYNDIATQKGNNTSVVLVDDYGNPVAGAGGPAHIPAGFYHQFDEMIKQGKSVAQTLAAALKIYPSPTLLPNVLTLTLSQWNDYLNLTNFRQGGPWDIQRLFVKSGIDIQYRDASTIGIGIYAASANLPLDNILEIENLYAMKRSNFNPSSNKKILPLPDMDKVYTHIPKRNVENTRIGYNLYKDHKIKGL